MEKIRLDTEKIRKEAKEIEPRQNMTFRDKLREDNVFLLALIDDPIKAFKEYELYGDDKVLSILDAMAANIRERAIRTFSETKERRSKDSREITFHEKLKKDKAFLLSLIDDPVKTANIYGYAIEDTGAMERYSEYTMDRARLIFDDLVQAAEGCNVCRACQLCSKGITMDALKKVGDGVIR